MATGFGDDHLPSEEHYYAYEMFRGRIRDEDVLVNHRTTWQLALQAVLLAAWAAIYNAKQQAAAQAVAKVAEAAKQSSGEAGVAAMAKTGSILMLDVAHPNLLMGLMASVGLVAGLCGIVTIWAAYREMRKARKYFKENYQELYHDKGIPKLTGSEEMHRLGQVVPYLAPAIFCVLQVALLASSFT